MQHRTQDFEFILNGIHNVMVQQMNSINNLLPGAKKPLPYVHEAIIFFWKMLELNKVGWPYRVLVGSRLTGMCILL